MSTDTKNLTLVAARKILGKEFEHLTDVELKQVINFTGLLKNIFFDVYLQQLGDKKGAHPSYPK